MTQSSQNAAKKSEARPADAKSPACPAAAMLPDKRGGIWMRLEAVFGRFTARG